MFTCAPLLETALTAAQKAGIPQNRVYIVDLPSEFVGNAKAPSQFKTLEQLIAAGKSLPEVERLQWGPGQGARTTAFVCYSSGTSGLPVSQLSYDIFNFIQGWRVQIVRVSDTNS